MGVQTVTREEFAGIIAALTTAINILTAQVVMLTTQVNNHTNNNINNQNRGGGPIGVPRGGKNRIIEDSRSSKVEEIDVLIKARKLENI